MTVEYFPFDRERAAEAAAYLLGRLGGRLTKLVLIKLLYLADRESLKRFGAPISGGRYCSLPHGPIISEALNLINEREVRRQGWALESIGNDVILHTAVAPRSLSDDDRSVLDNIAGTFGQLSVGALLKFVHALPEYTKPTGGKRSLDLSTHKMLLGHGVDPARIATIQAELDERGAFRALLAKASAKH